METSFDFRRPEWLSRDQLRALSTRHEPFARELAGILSRRTGTHVEARLHVVDQMTPREFACALPGQTAVAVLQPYSLPGPFVLEINPMILVPLANRLLARGFLSGPQLARSVRDLVEAVLAPVLPAILERLARAWSWRKPVGFDVEEVGSNSLVDRALDRAGGVVCFVIEVSLGKERGYVNLAAPVGAAEAVLGDAA